MVQGQGGLHRRLGVARDRAHDGGGREYELRNISPAGSPMFPEAAACNAAAGEHSALALAMAWVEQKYGTYQQIIPASFHNPMSLRGGGGWQQFSSYAEGIAAWRRLLNDSSGPYAGTKTVAELIHVYAPSSDGNDEARYVADIERLVTRYRALEGTTPGPSPNGDSPGETGYVAGDYCRLVNRFQVGDRIPGGRRPTQRSLAAQHDRRSRRAIFDWHRILRARGAGLRRKSRVVPG